ncbi:MAG: ABC transporter permease [Acidobacteria bacterium]|nr:ABC transporter permease [Acidobacteriota bacterium]
MKRLLTREWLYSIGLLAVLLVIWEVSVKYLEIPFFLLPPPSGVLMSLQGGFAESLTSRVGFYLHTYYTVSEALLGFLIGSGTGMILGTLIAQSRFVGKVLLPYIVAFQSLPKVALAPLLIVWFGVGMTSKVVIVAMLTFFPLLVNSIAGFESVDPDRLEMMRSFKATPWQIFRKVRFPSALPFIFAGLSMAIVYSLIGAIVGEFIGGRHGLGILILQMNFNMDMQGVFSVFVVLSVIGIVFYSAMQFIERRVVFWTARSRDVTGL